MARIRRSGWALGLALGLVAGLIFGGLWPRTPLYATATDRVENFAIATGFVDQETEAVFYLDYLTGTLTGATVARGREGFQAMFKANVHKDLAAIVGTSGGQLPQSPNYLMVTGAVKLPNMGRLSMANTIIYVAETNTGVVMAYAVPWSQAAYSASQPFTSELILRAGAQFSGAVLRPE